jgi:hypothetical protein
MYEKIMHPEKYKVNGKIQDPEKQTILSILV